MRDHSGVRRSPASTRLWPSMTAPLASAIWSGELAGQLVRFAGDDFGERHRFAFDRKRAVRQPEPEHA